MQILCRKLFQEAAVTLYSICCVLSHCNVLVDNSHWKCAFCLFVKVILSVSARLLHFTVSFVRVTEWCNFVVSAKRYDTIALMWLNGATDNVKALLEPHHRKSKLHGTHLNTYPQHLGRRCVYLLPLCKWLNGGKKQSKGEK